MTGRYRGPRVSLGTQSLSRAAGWAEFGPLVAATHEAVVSRPGQLRLDEVARLRPNRHAGQDVVSRAPALRTAWDSDHESRDRKSCPRRRAPGLKTYGTSAIRVLRRMARSSERPGRTRAYQRIVVSTDS